MLICISEVQTVIISCTILEYGRIGETYPVQADIICFLGSIIYCIKVLTQQGFPSPFLFLQDFLGRIRTSVLDFTASTVSGKQKMFSKYLLNCFEQN
jgi:hypothetical protein